MWRRGNPGIEGSKEQEQGGEQTGKVVRAGIEEGGFQINRVQTKRTGDAEQFLLAEHMVCRVDRMYLDRQVNREMIRSIQTIRSD
jgi:hypothetical protein